MYHAAARANYPKLSNAAINVYSGLFHINRNPNYSQIELFDRYLVNLAKKKQPTIAKNLEKNLTDLSFATQKIGAQHEEYNKKGQNIFKGESVEDFEQAFSIVDDLWVLRSQKIVYCDAKDTADVDQAKVSIFEPLISKIRVGLRKSQYFANPSDQKDLTSITGEKLNVQLEKIYSYGVETSAVCFATMIL